MSPGVELEVSLLVLLAVVGLDIITWVVGVGPCTVQVYKQSITIVQLVHSRLHTHIMNVEF